MRFRNTVAIAILFVALGAYLWFVERGKMAAESQKKTLLAAIDKDKVTRVTLEYPERRIVVQKTGSGWRLQEPLDAEADRTAVENLVRAVVEAEVKRTLEGSDLGSPETYGLDKPKVVVTLGLADGSTAPAIRVGKNTPVGYSAFVQLSGDSSVKLVSSAFATGMQKEPKDLRNKEILDFSDEEVRKIEIEAPGGDAPPLEIVRADSGWKILRPRELAADDGEVRTFLSSLRAIRAQEFFDPPQSLPDFGLEPPRRKILLRVGKDETAKELWVGAEKERDGKKELYVQRAGNPTIFAIGTYAWSNLSKTVQTFRDKTVLPFDRERLGAVEVTRADGEAYRIVRVESKGSESKAEKTAAKGASAGGEPSWAIAGEEARSRKSLVSQLVGDIEGLKGYEVAAEHPADLGPFGFASPSLVFSLLDREGQPIGRILVSQVGGEGDSEKKSYAMAEGADIVFRIRDYLFTHLDKKAADLLEAPPTPSPTEAPADTSLQATPTPSA
jgi:hypothetical protein